VRHLSLVLAVGLCAAGPGALAQDLDPQDLENRIDYAYLTEDATALRNLIRSSEEALAKGVPTSEMHYLLGFAHYRLGKVLAAKDEANAVKALSKCVDEVDETTEADEQFAEGYALEAACLGQLSGLGGMTARINGPKSASRLDKALKLAPKNPRVALVDGLSDHRNGDKARALNKLRRAAELFDQSAQNPAAMPRWGHADAYAALGRSLLETGDTLGARNAVERALIIAPEFAVAKRLLAQVIGTH
jgi:Flp pilus assembly protein TadD